MKVNTLHWTVERQAFSMQDGSATVPNTFEMYHLTLPSFLRSCLAAQLIENKIWPTVAFIPSEVFIHLCIAHRSWNIMNGLRKAVKIYSVSCISDYRFWVKSSESSGGGPLPALQENTSLFSWPFLEKIYSSEMQRLKTFSLKKSFQVLVLPICTRHEVLFLRPW